MDFFCLFRLCSIYNAISLTILTNQYQYDFYFSLDLPLKVFFISSVDRSLLRKDIDKILSKNEQTRMYKKYKS